MSDGHSHDFSQFRIINRHGPAHGPTIPFLVNPPGGIDPAAKMRRNLIYVWTAGFWNCTVGLLFTKNRNKQQKTPI